MTSSLPPGITDTQARILAAYHRLKPALRGREPSNHAIARLVGMDPGTVLYQRRRLDRAGLLPYRPQDVARFPDPADRVAAGDLTPAEASIVAAVRRLSASGTPATAPAVAAAAGVTPAGVRHAWPRLASAGLVPPAPATDPKAAVRARTAAAGLTQLEAALVAAHAEHAARGEPVWPALMAERLGRNVSSVRTAWERLASLGRLPRWHAQPAAHDDEPPPAPAAGAEAPPRLGGPWRLDAEALARERAAREARGELTPEAARRDRRRREIAARAWRPAMTPREACDAMRREWRAARRRRDRGGAA